jgi:AcrR family transcriptional regulator
MDDATQNLAKLAVKGLAAVGQGWQQRKSVQTRLAILEAAIDCLDKYGYGRSTTQLIAQTAGISRGAMLHHYTTKQELISAIIDYTFYKRMEVFTASITSLSETERVVRQDGIEIFWRSLLSREYSAYIELSIASRTDAELHAMFIPRAIRFDQIWRVELLRIFPEWSAHPDKLNFAIDYCHAAFEGLRLNREVWTDRNRRVALRSFVTSTIFMIREGKLDIPELAEEPEPVKKSRRAAGR